MPLYYVGLVTLSRCHGGVLSWYYIQQVKRGNFALVSYMLSHRTMKPQYTFDEGAGITIGGDRQISLKGWQFVNARDVVKLYCTLDVFQFHIVGIWLLMFSCYMALACGLEVQNVSITWGYFLHLPVFLAWHGLNDIAGLGLVHAACLGPVRDITGSLQIAMETVLPL